MMHWERARSLLLKRMPIGILLAPFEFGTAVTWLTYGVRFLIDNFTPGETDMLRAALPLNGVEFTAWSIMLPLSSALMIVGLAATVALPIAGFYVERIGLLGMFVTITTLLYALVTQGHLSLLSLTSISTSVTILVVALRFITIGATLETLRKRLEVEREAQ